jgi:hypothetical protein
MARAFLISPEQQSIAPVEVASEADIAELVGYDTLESDDVSGDRLYFDEECFIRGASGRFQIDKLIPVAGKGVVVGVADGGGGFVDVGLAIDELKSRTVFS